MTSKSVAPAWLKSASIAVRERRLVALQAGQTQHQRANVGEIRQPRHQGRCGSVGRPLGHIRHGPGRDHKAADAAQGGAGPNVTGDALPATMLAEMPASHREPTRWSSRTPTTGSRGSFARLAALGFIAAVVGGALLVGHWYLAKRSLAWQARRGLQLLEMADTPAKVRAALDRWDTETRANWEGRRDELVSHLLGGYPLEDARARLLLTWVAGADYGARREDWQRWNENRRRLEHGQSLRVPRREAVPLKLLWTAPVGLTAWFTTILPLDGQVYVASLGADFDDPEDRCDGVVRVDGHTGVAELLFSPPGQHRGPRDVIGIAAGDDGLFVACHNGSVYYIDAEGQVHWHAHAGDPIVAPPLAVDINQDRTTDVLVLTRAIKTTVAKAVAMNGRGGRTLWASTVGRPPAGESGLGGSLALGESATGAGPNVIAALPAGELTVLALRSGEVQSRQALPAGSIAGALCRGGPAERGPAGYVGDRGACIWFLAGQGRKLEAVPRHVLAVRREETLVAALRTLSLEPSQPPLLLACPTGDYARGAGAACLLAPDGIRWRLPLPGAIWGTPAVADLNGDGRLEIVLVTIEPAADGSTVGVLTVASAGGHIVQRVVLGAALECSPVVADVDGDNRLEVLVADQAGRLYCFCTPGFGPVEWGLFGGDSRNTRNATNAYAWGQTVFGRQWQWRPE